MTPADEDQVLVSVHSGFSMGMMMENQAQWERRASLLKLYSTEASIAKVTI
jgi:hypothetical protein